MNILITAGSTLDFIDDINFISNISNGKIAAGIGEELSKHSNIDQIFYVCGKKTKYPWQHQSSNDSKFFLDEWLDKIAIYPVDDVSELEKSVTDLFSKFNIDCVIHLMNINSYGDSKIHLLNNQNDAMNLINSISEEFDLGLDLNFDKKLINDNKIISGYNKLFIEQQPTKKILSLFKELKNDVIVFSSKFSPNNNKELLFINSKESLLKNKSDIVIASNIDESDNKVYFVSENDVVEFDDIEETSDHILKILNI